MRLSLIAGNWKMNTTLEEAVALVKAIRPGLDKIDGVEKLVCPPYISLAAVGDALKGSSVMLGAQNMYCEEKGAYTGEIAPPMLTGLCDYVILGHSERRHIFGESAELIDKKVRAAVAAEVKPILCVGERLEENESGQTEEVLTQQLTASADRLYYAGGMAIAYEPVWAIGTGKSATPEQANATIGFIRQLVAKQQGNDIADSVRILYGGSVTAANITGLMEQPEIDGALVGGASLKADDFVSIAAQAAAVRGGR